MKSAMGNNFSKRKVLTYEKYLKVSEEKKRNKKKSVQKLDEIHLTAASTSGSAKTSAEATGKTKLQNRPPTPRFRKRSENVQQSSASTKGML